MSKSQNLINRADIEIKTEGNRGRDIMKVQKNSTLKAILNSNQENIYGRQNLMHTRDISKK